MSTDRDVTRIVRSWLEEGATALPDRVLDTVLDQLPATPQRRAWWPAWRLRHMITPIRFAGYAVAISVIAAVGLSVLPRDGGVGGQISTPSPTPSPVALQSGVDLEAGTTYYMDDPCCLGTGRLVLTVPAPGWFTFDTVNLGKNGLRSIEGHSIAATLYRVANVYADPCHWTGTALDPPVGPTVDDLATALVEQPLQNASAVTDVVMGGYPGKKVELSIPDDVERLSCESGHFGRWSTPGDPTKDAPYTFGNGQRNTVYIIDVGGKRQVIDTMYLPGTSESDLAELEAILASIRFEPLASPEASTSPVP